MVIISWPENSDLFFLLKNDFIPYPENRITFRLPNTPIDPNVTVVDIE